MSIASEITRLQNAKDALKTSINAKTDAQNQIDDETLDEYADFVDTITTGGGGSTVEEKDVNFYDYDGTLVDSYSKADFLALNSLPENPTHDGLTAQGWNWSLADAKTYVTSYDELDIGQIYITDDEKTRIYITLEEGRLTPYLSLYLKGTVVIDWGDGSSTDTLTGTSLSTRKETSHTYSTGGNYIISIEASTNTTTFKGENGYFLYNGSTTSVTSSSSYYISCITKIEIGKGYTELGSYNFNNAILLKTITIPKNVTKINSYCFQNCTNLKALIFPKETTGMLAYCFSACYGLEKVVLSNGLTNLSDYAFQNCYSLKKVILPNSLTSLATYTFRNCYQLTKVIIPNTVTTINNYCFDGDRSIVDVKLSNALTDMGTYTFQNCYVLRNIVLPTTLTSIKNSFCSSNYSLVYVICNGDISSLASYCFQSCYSLKYIDFTNCTAVPTLSNSNAFSNSPSDLQIVVPDSLYSTWIAATNWSSLASKIVKESVFNA